MNKSSLTGMIAAGLTFLAVARPMQKANADLLQIDSFAGPGVNEVSSLYLSHTAGASEGTDGFDFPVPPSPPSGQWLKLYTSPYGSQLALDYRPPNSLTTYNGFVAGVDGSGNGITTTNYFTISLSNPIPGRSYDVSFHEDGALTPNGEDFNLSTNFSSGTINISAPGFRNLRDGNVGLTFSVTPVPEPSTGLLAIAGLGAGAIALRKRRLK